jgi:hypothetical protein
VYRLKHDAAAEAIHNSLPPEARLALSLALADACEDPIGATEPYGLVDDGVMRKIMLPDSFAILLIGREHKELTVLQIEYLR